MHRAISGSGAAEKGVSVEGGELKEGGPALAALPFHWIPNQSPGGSVPLLRDAPLARKAHGGMC